MGISGLVKVQFLTSPLDDHGLERHDGGTFAGLSGQEQRSSPEDLGLS